MEPMNDIMKKIEERLTKDTGREYISTAHLKDRDILIEDHFIMKDGNREFIVAMFDKNKFTFTFHEQPISKMKKFENDFGNMAVKVTIKADMEKRQAIYDLV